MWGDTQMASALSPSPGSEISTPPTRSVEELGYIPVITFQILLSSLPKLIFL